MRILAPFSLCLLWALCGSALLPEVRLFHFSPFFAYLYHRAPLHKAIWIATLAGLLLDLLSGEARLGYYALTACGTTLLLQGRRLHFFEDKPISLALLTWCISLVFTGVQWTLCLFWGAKLSLSLALVGTDLLVLPVCDALYGLALIYTPLLLITQVQKKGARAVWLEVKQRLGFAPPAPEEA
jgi:hypothetical protein